MDFFSILEVGYNTDKTDLLFSHSNGRQWPNHDGRCNLFSKQLATIGVISLFCLISVNAWQWFVVKGQFQDYAAILEIKNNPEFNLLMWLSLLQSQLH